jgi:hypothetical protein
MGTGRSWTCGAIPSSHPDGPMRKVPLYTDCEMEQVCTTFQPGSRSVCLTSENYAHVSNKALGNIRSPLDDLDL